MTFGRDENRQSIMGALKPGHGQSVSRAIITTYSLDLVAMLGLVLSLGGDPDAEFENSPLGLVKAFEQMRGRLVVLHQLGRVIAPARHRSILPLLDTMVRAVSADERKASWHPKIALVRYEAAGKIEWRFWIGSRNLTGSTDLDAGLLLVSGNDRSAKFVPDIADLAENFLRDANIPSTELDELRSARWIAPPGISVRNILWRRHGEESSFLRSAMIPRAERACAVSPFIDRTGLDELLNAGAGDIMMLTTDIAAANCIPPDGIKFRVDTTPEPAAPVSVEQQQEAAGGEFLEPPSTGIHAKLLAVSKGARTALLLGSANHTKRGLLGPNAEAVALLDVADEALIGSLYRFVATGCEPAAIERDADLVEQEQARRNLDALISRFLRTRFQLRLDEAGLHLELAEIDGDVMMLAHFQVAAFIEDEEWVPIMHGATSVRIQASPPTLSEQTALVNFRATSAGDPRVSRTWVQAVEIAGIDMAKRDRALLARYVGANRFRDWLRSLLDGIDGTGGQKWSDGGAGVGRHETAGRLSNIFTLETMLASWARDTEAFEARISGMMQMLDSFEEAFGSIPDEHEREAALGDIAEVRPFLQAVSEAIGAAA